MVITFDNGKDKIIVDGGEEFDRVLNITNNSPIPTSPDFINTVGLLYYEHRLKAETPSISK